MSDEFDDLIRSRLRSSASSPSRSSAALEELKPTMVRARRRHRVAVGAMTASTVVLAGVGVVALERVVRSPDTVQTVPFDDPLPGVDETDNGLDGAAPTSVVVDASDVDGGHIEGTIPVIQGEPGRRIPIETIPPTESQTTTHDEPFPPIVTTPPRGTMPAPDSPAPTVTPPTPSPTVTVPAITTTVPPPTTRATPTTTVVATTTTVVATTTSVPQPGERVIASSCGTVTVAYEIRTVTLVETQPGSGFAVDVKNAGPGEVEVGFAGGDVECQIKAKMEAGQLVVDVEDPGA